MPEALPTPYDITQIPYFPWPPTAYSRWQDAVCRKPNFEAPMLKHAENIGSVPFSLGIRLSRRYPSSLRNADDFWILFSGARMLYHL